MAKITSKTVTFEADCTRCNGTGNWAEREGYPCRLCNATGKVRVALRGNAHGSFTFHVVSAAGTITKEYFHAKAELLTPMERYSVGATTGSGWYAFKTGTDPVGSPVGVYGYHSNGDYAGEFIVRWRGGGYGRTGYHPCAFCHDKPLTDGKTCHLGSGPNHGQTIKVRLLDEAAQAALASL